MELIGVVIIPVLIFLAGLCWKLHRASTADARVIENRFTEIESRVSRNEEKIKALQTDIREIDRLVQELTEVKINIAKILTILEERNK